MTNETNKHKEKVTLKIPRPLYEKIAAVINGAGYNSVTDFVVYVLRDLVASHSLAAHPAPRQDADDLENVKKRLQALGYLDSQPKTDSNSVKG